MKMSSGVTYSHGRQVYEAVPHDPELGPLNVGLDFPPRRDGTSGLIRWPHISINTLEKELD